jgi:multiple sugar transport system permease protein
LGPHRIEDVVAVRGSWRRYWPYLPLGIWALIVLFPIYWLVVTSFKPALAVSQGPTYLPWVDFQPTLHAWEGILFGAQAPAIRRAFVNSVVVGGVSSLLALLLGSLGAYGLTRFRYRLGFLRNRDILVFIVSQRMMPPIVTALALFLMLHAVGLTDTRLGLILVYTAFNLPLAAWLMHNFFSQVPPDLEEAAMVDGGTRFQVFWRIVVPVSLPGLVATFFFTLIFAWNEFLFALILTSRDAQTLPIFIAAQHSQRGVQWWSLSAMSLVTVLPVLLFTLGVHRFLVERILTGSGK